MEAGQVWTALAAALVSYLLGALPFSLWIAKAQGVDIQAVGSGNPGATNVARSVGMGWGILALLLDLGKGVTAGITVAALQAPLPLAGFAVLGHNWSLFLRLGGGKGVATSLGVLFVASWSAGLSTAGIWLVLVALTRKVSVGSVIALMASPLFLWWMTNDLPLVVLFATLALLGLVRHWQNIQRLLQGREHALLNKKEDP